MYRREAFYISLVKALNTGRTYFDSLDIGYKNLKAIFSIIIFIDDILGSDETVRSYNFIFN